MQALRSIYTGSSPDYDPQDEVKLENLGYKQELRRGMGLLGSIGLCTGIIQPLLNGGSKPLPAVPGCFKLIMGVFNLGFFQGGPTTVIWGFLIYFLCSFGLMLSMAEISSKYITAGGPYNWAGRSMCGDLPVKILGREFNFGSLPAYVSAWLIILSFFGSMASVNSAGAQALMSMDLMRTYGADPHDPLSRRHLDIFMTEPPYLSHQGSQNTWRKLFGISVGMTMTQFFINFLPLKYMNLAAWAAFFIMVFGCLMIIIGLPAISPSAQSWEWVWTSWYSQEDSPVGANLAKTGLPTNGWMMCAGMLMAEFLVVCYDQPAHMAEETHNASWTVPRAIVGSFICAGLLNLWLLLAYLFSLQGVGGIRHLGTGVTQGLYPIGNLFWDVFAKRFPDRRYQDGMMPGLLGSDPSRENETASSDYLHASTTTSDAGCLLLSGAACINVATGQPNLLPTARNGAMFFTFIIFCGAYVCGLMNCCAGARFIYSLARDGALPFSGIFKRVNSYNGVPMYALTVFVMISIAFLCSQLSTVPLEGYVSVSAISSNGYAMAYGVPCLLRLTLARNTFTASKDFDLGFLSKPLAALGVAVAAFAVASISLPSLLPATKDNLNYAPVALGSAIVGSLIFWPIAVVFWGYVGPSSGVGSDSVKAGVENAAPAAAGVEMFDTAKDVGEQDKKAVAASV